MKKLLLFVSILFASCAQTVSKLEPTQGSGAWAEGVQITFGQPTMEVQPGAFTWDWQLTPKQKDISNQGFSLLDVDGFTTTKEQVAQIKAVGTIPVCYIDAGSLEVSRPDANTYPNYLRLKADPDWPGEYFLDIRDINKPNSVLVQNINRRFQMCKDKGFTWIEPDNQQNFENVGKPLTLSDQLAFDQFLADAGHALGLKVFQKNAPDLVLNATPRGDRLVDVFDGILNEQCQQYKECANLKEYSSRGKLALDTEYKRSLTLDCKTFSSLGVHAIKRDLDLTTPGSSGYKRTSCE